jgi:hypothetical protein
MGTWRERAQRAGEKVQAIALALLGLVACLHGEGSARGPSDPSIAGSEAGLLAVSSVDDADEATRASEPASAERDYRADDEEDSASAETEPESDTAVDVEADAPERRPLAGAPASAKKARPSDAEASDEPAPAPDMLSEPDADGGDAEADPRAVTHPGPPITMTKLLGVSRARIERRLDREGEAGDGGWIHYGPKLAIRYQQGRAVEAALRVPAGMTCVDAARWAGFTKAMPPLLRVDGCAWPGISDRHRLHRGVAGELARATGVLQIWSTKD